MWDVWGFAAAGEPAPAIAPSAAAITISAALAAGGGPAGVGVSVHGPQCVDETNFARGLTFTLSGSLGGCSLYLDVIGSTDQSSQLDTCRGACAGDPASCTPASVQITEMGNVSVVNMSFYGGSPNPAPDLTKLIGFRWRLAAPSGNAGCSAQLSIGNVQFVGP
jgi:hypothetical protein